MRIDGIELREGSHITNLTVDTGPVFPQNPNAGELFYKNTNDGDEALYVYNDTTWVSVSGGGGGGGQSTTINGDLSGTVVPGQTSTLTLATVNSNVGSFGSTAAVGTFVVNAKGLITSAGTSTIAINANQVTTGSFADARISQSSVTQHQGALAISTAQVTSGAFDNARIAQSNVTQYQGALSIAETQIPNGALLARNADNETITGTWTFNNPIVGTLTGSSSLNVLKAGDTMSGPLNATRIITYDPDGIRLKSGAGTAGIASVFRNDGVNTYMLLTNDNDSNGPWNSLRPFTLNGASGNITIKNLFGDSAYYGRFLAADGTNLAPSYSFSADSDTGINHTADGEIQTIVNSVLTSSTTNTVHRQDTNFQLGTQGTSRRFLSDFTSSPVNLRTFFQTIVADSPTVISTMPSGSGTAASYHTYNSSDPTNTSLGVFRTNSSETALLSNTIGTGTLLPLNFYLNNVLKMGFEAGGAWGLYTNDNKMGAPTGDVILNIGAGATANRFALTDYIGDATYNDFGLRVGRTNTGPNSTSIIQHRGTSNLQLNALDAGFIEFLTNNTQAGYVDPSGWLNWTKPIQINKVTSGGSAFIITDTSPGGAGITLNGNGSTTPNKSIRAIAGNLEVINSAYSAVIFTIADDGTILPNAIRTTGNIVGRTIVSRPPVGGTEGGQFVLAYTGYPNIVDQATGSWNIDVDSANNLRFFKINGSNVTGNVMYLADTDSAFHFTGSGMFLKGIGSGDTFIEMGSFNNVASNPFIDFHSGATTVDFDSRIQASGGNGGTGGGNLSYYATNHYVHGTLIVDNTVFATQFYTNVASIGNVKMETGSAANTGYVGFYAANGVRQGYVGFATGSGAIDTGQTNYVAGVHAFSGSLINAASTPAIFSSVATTGSGIAYRLKDANDTSGIASLLYSDTANFYFLLTNNNDSNGSFNSLRPLIINKSTGYVTITGQASFALDTNSIASAVGGSYNWTGTEAFISNKGSSATIAGTSSYGLQAQATDNGPAGMSFHRTGAYAMNIGLNPDGNFCIGGWSDGNVNRMILSPTGAVTFPTAVNTGYYTGSVTGSSYGSIKVSGLTAGFAGMYMSDASGTVVGMHNAGGDGGTWDSTTGWHFFWSRAQQCLAIGGAATSASYKLTVPGAVYVAGAIYATGDVTAFSDERTKKNVEPIAGALEKLQEVRGVTFERIGEDTGRRHTGVIAQELEKVLPEAVFIEPDSGMKTVAYGNTIGLLIEAIKELNAKVESLQAQLNAKA